MGTNYEQLNCEERTMIQLSLEQGCKLRATLRKIAPAGQFDSAPLYLLIDDVPAFLSLPIGPGQDGLKIERGLIKLGARGV